MNCRDESRGKGPTSTLVSASTNPEPFDKAKKDKKKKQHRDERDSREPKDSTTPAFRVNAAEVGGKRKRRNKKDVSEITCFNYNKKGHYSNKCPELSKN